MDHGQNLGSGAFGEIMEMSKIFCFMARESFADIVVIYRRSHPATFPNLQTTRQTSSLKKACPIYFLTFHSLYGSEDAISKQSPGFDVS